MSLSRTLAAAGAAVLISTALVGCGSSSSDDKTLTATEFKAQANKLCSAAKKDTDKMGESLSETSTDEEVTKAVDDAVARNTQLVDDLDALKAPKSLQSDVDDLLKSFFERFGNGTVLKGQFSLLCTSNADLLFPLALHSRLILLFQRRAREDDDQHSQDM